MYLTPDNEPANGTPLHRLAVAATHQGQGRPPVTVPVLAGDVADVCYLLPDKDKTVTAFEAMTADKEPTVTLKVKTADLQHLIAVAKKGMKLPAEAAA